MPSRRGSGRAYRRVCNPDEFPTVQLLLLAIVRLAEPIALTSIFPYAFPLVKRLNVGNEEDASFYAGLVISAFSFFEALMGMYWGAVSDRVGRKPVLLLGCMGTMFSMLLVGLANNIWVALLGRAIGGFLNGNIGVIQTMVGELVIKPEHEPKAYSIMPFVWSLGTIIGPMIGGLFADPHDSWPKLFPSGSLFARFPYLLPNLICAGLLAVSILLGYFLLDETHPDKQPRVLLPDDTYLSENTPLLETSDALKRPAVDLRDENYGSVRERITPIPPAPKVDDDMVPTIWTKRIMAIIISLSIFTYHSMTFDHLLPIFLEDPRSHASTTAYSGSLFFAGGLGLSLHTVGLIMAVQGFIALFTQAVIFPLAASYFGIYQLFILVTVFHPVVYLSVPPLALIPAESTFLLHTAIYAMLVLRNLLGILLYPLLLILLKDATPSSNVLGKVNGLAASAGAACRMVAPPVAGMLYAMGKKSGCTPLAWWASALVALVGSVQCFWVPRERRETEKEAA